METQDIRIETLPAMRVASFYAYSTEPELDAWKKVITWSKLHGCWKEAPATRIFGFDNPTESEGSPNRGYEFWVTVGPDVQSDAEVKVKEFTGGKYAILRCNVTGNPFEVIPATWGKLIQWLEASPYTFGSHQGVEEHFTRNETIEDNFILDLYLPITER